MKLSQNGFLILKKICGRNFKRAGNLSLNFHIITNNLNLGMGHYRANSTDSYKFNVMSDNIKVGDLVYKKWYSFEADILMADGSKFQLRPKGFWDSKVELTDESTTLLEIKMGWKGIVIKTYFDRQEKHYLLKLKGLLGDKFILIDDKNQEFMRTESDFKWKTLNYEYSIETTESFDRLGYRNLLLLALVHSMNYYMTFISSAS